MGIKAATGGASSVDSTAPVDPPVFKKNPEEFAVVAASVLRAHGPAVIKSEMIGRWLSLHPDPKEQARFLIALTPLLAKAPAESLPEVAALLRESAASGPAQNAPALNRVADVLAPPAALPADRVVTDDAPKATPETKKATLAPPSKDPVLAGAAGRIADLCAGYTSSGDEKKILATVREYIGETSKPSLPPAERSQRAHALITELEKRGITYGRVVDELDSADDKKAFLDATLAAATPDQKADAIQQASHNWLWRLLELFFGFADDRQTVAQITASAVSPKDGGVGKQSADNYRELFAACDRAGVDFETLYDNLPKTPPEIREHFVAVATQSMTLEQRAHAIALLVHGATPENKERAIGHLLKDNVLPEERQTLLAAIKRYDVEFSDLKGELGAADRAFLLSAYADPTALAAFTQVGLPVMVADFEAARAKTVTAVTQPILDAVESGATLMPGVALRKDAEELGSPNPKVREAAVARVSAALDQATSAIAARVAAGQQEIARLSGVIAEDDEKIVAAGALATQLSKASPGSPASLDATRTLAFLQEQRGKIAQTRDALATATTALAAQTQFLRIVGGAVANMTGETAGLVAEYVALAQATASPPSASADPTNKTDATSQLALLHRFEILGHKLATTRAELTSDATRQKQALASGVLEVIDANLSVVRGQVQGLVSDVMQLHFVERTQSELQAQKASIDGSTFVQASSDIMATGSDAQIDAFASGYAERMAAVQAEFKRLEGEKRAAEAVVAKFKGAPPETTDDRLALAKAKMTLAGVTPGTGKAPISLAETISALKQTAAVLEQSRVMLSERRTMLRDGLNQQLNAAGLPTVTGTSNEALWAAMIALSMRLGLPVPPAPVAGATFAAAADPMGKYIAEARSAQLGTGLMVVTMLKGRGVDVPSASWVDGKLELPHLALKPGQKPPPAVDMVATQKLIDAALTLLAKDVGVATIDDASMIALVKVARGEKSEGTPSSLFAAMQAQAFERTVLDGAGFRALAGVKNHLTLSELKAIAHGDFAPGMTVPSDAKERERIRNAAYLIVSDVEVRDALLANSGSKDGLSADVIDSFGARLYDYAPKDKDHPEVVPGRIPASAFVYHIDMTRTLPQALEELHSALHPDASVAKWEAVLKNLPLATRQLLVTEYDRIYSTRDKPGLLYRELADAWSGTDRGRAMAMLDGPSAAERSHQIFFRAGGVLDGKLSEIEGWQNTFDVDFNTGFWSFLYDISGTRPSAAERTLLGKDIEQVKKNLAAYKEAARTGDPNVENLRAQLAQSLGVAAEHLYIMRSGSDEATDNAIRKLEVAGSIAKAVTITAVATAVTLGTLGAAAPAAEGLAGASWAAVGASVVAGTAAGTATGALLSVSTQYIETGSVDAKKLGADTRDAAIMSFTTALTAGVSTAAMAKMVAAAANGGRMATVMSSPVWRAVVMSGMNTGLTVAGEGAGIILRATTGDTEGASKAWHELPITAVRSFVDSMLLAGIGGKFHGVSGRSIDGASQGLLQMAWNKAQGKELSEGLAQSIINGMVMGQVFETSHAMMELRAAGQSKVRGPGEPASAKASWKITGFDETVNRVTLERIGPKGVPERMEVDSSVLVEANAQLKAPKEVVQPKLTKEAAAAQIKSALSPEQTLELGGRQWNVTINETTGLVRLEAVGRPDLVHELAATVLVDRMAKPIAAGLESAVVPGMGNGLAAKSSAFAAVDHAMRTSGKVSMASIELHQFKDWGNVEGNHSIGNAYIAATANELQIYLRANGFADAQVFHQGGKGFRIVYAGGDEAHFAQVMQGLTKAPASTKFKVAIDAEVRQSVSPAEAMQLKPASDIHLYVGMAVAPEGAMPRDCAYSREVTETLFEHSYASGKFAQLSGQGLVAKPGEKIVSPEAAVAAGKKAQRDTFASYDTIASGVEFSRMSAEPAFVNEMGGYGMAISDANIALAGTADPSTLSLATKEQLFLSGDIGKTKGGRLIIYGRNLADYYARTLTDAVAAGTARPCELLISETGGDEVRVLKVEIGANGKPVLHSYAIDINDFGAASNLSSRTADGVIVPGTKVADGIKSQVFDQLDTALSDPSTRGFADKLADANTRLYGALADPRYAITGKVEAHEVSGFGAGKNWSPGETGTIRLGEVTYKGTVTAAGKMRLLAPEGKVVELGFEASGTDGGPQKLTLKVPNVRTTLSMGGMTIAPEALETVTVDGHGVTRFSKAFLDKLGAGARYAAAPEPNLEAFMAKVTDAYANFLKKNGKAPAVGADGQVEPRAFVSEMFSDPKFAGQLKNLFAAEYADRPHTRDLPQELKKLADDYLAGTTGTSEYDSAAVSQGESQSEVATALSVPKLDATSIADSILVDKRAVAGSGRALAEQVAVARMLQAQGIGPRVLGVTDLGGGKFAIVTEKISAGAPITTADLPAVRALAERLRVSGFDLRGATFAKGANGELLVTSGVVRMGGAPPSLSGEAISLALAAGGTTVMREVTPAQAQAALHSQLKGIPGDQAAALTRALNEAQGKVSIARDDKGSFTIIDSVELPDGARALRTTTVDKLGNLSASESAQVIDATGTAIKLPAGPTPEFVAKLTSDYPRIAAAIAALPEPQRTSVLGLCEREYWARNFAGEPAGVAILARLGPLATSELCRYGCLDLFAFDPDSFIRMAGDNPLALSRLADSGLKIPMEIVRSLGLERAAQLAAFASSAHPSGQAFEQLRRQLGERAEAELGPAPTDPAALNGYQNAVRSRANQLLSESFAADPAGFAPMLAQRQSKIFYSGDGVVLLKGEPRTPHRPVTVVELAPLAKKLGISSELLAKVMADPGANPLEARKLMDAITAGLPQAEQAALAREMAGRHFVDKKHFDPAYAAGVETPELRYGSGAWAGWKAASESLAAKAASGEPLTLETVLEAHRLAGEPLGRRAKAGTLRTESVVQGGDGPGVQEVSAASYTAMLGNPDLQIVELGAGATPGSKRVMVTYLEASQVPARLNQVIDRLNQRLAVVGEDPIKVAADAQRELVSVHPFMDGNGRISRLIMDYVLARAHMPPTLIANPDLDTAVDAATWQKEVAKGVGNSWDVYMTFWAKTHPGK